MICGCVTDMLHSRHQGNRDVISLVDGGICSYVGLCPVIARTLVILQRGDLVTLQKGDLILRRGNLILQRGDLILRRGGVKVDKDCGRGKWRRSRGARRSC